MRQGKVPTGMSRLDRPVTTGRRNACVPALPALLRYCVTPTGYRPAPRASGSTAQSTRVDTPSKPARTPSDDDTPIRRHVIDLKTPIKYRSPWPARLTVLAATVALFTLIATR